MTAKETSERIAAAAKAILTTEGAPAVTMRRVADEVGVTAMAIYKHFPSRDVLLHAVADAAFQEITRTWGRRSAMDTFDARLAGLLDDLLDFALGQPHLYAFLIVDQRERVRSHPIDLRVHESPTFTPVLRLVEEGMRAGWLATDDPFEVTLSITSSAQGLLQLYFGRQLNLDEGDFRAFCHRTVQRILVGVRSGADQTGQSPV